MRLSTILIVSIILLTSSCSLKVSYPSFKEVLSTETKLVSSHIIREKYSGVFKEILFEALNMADLPKDYAKISFLKTGPIPVMSSGVSTEIYVSEAFIDYLNSNFITKTDLQLYLLHEIAHKRLNHSYLLVAQPSMVVGYQELSLNNVLALAYIAVLNQSGLLQKTNGQSLKPVDYLRVSQAINQNLQLKNSKDVAKIPFLGYPYTDEMEYAADEYVIALLAKKKNIHIARYGQALEKVKNIYALSSTRLSNFMSKKIDKRLDHIKYIRRNT